MKWGRFLFQKRTVPVSKKGGMYLPRKPREHSVTNLYHIIIRGIDRNDIFYDNQDRYVFLNILKETKERFKFEIYSYCLMNNHIHIVFRIKDEFLSKSMQSLEIRYSAYFNKKINRNGHLFQNRFFSKKIENLNYFLAVLEEYASKDGVVATNRTEDYKWSSFKEYIGKEKIINKSVLLHYFDGNIEKFKKYNLENDDKEQLYNLAEFEIKRKLTEEEVAKIIIEKWGLNNISDILAMSNENKKDIVKSLKNIKGTNIHQLSRVMRLTDYFIKNIWDE